MTRQTVEFSKEVDIDPDSGTLTIHLPREMLQEIQDRVRVTPSMDPPVEQQPYDRATLTKESYLPPGAAAGEGGGVVITIGPIVTIQPSPSGPKPAIGAGIRIEF